MLVFTLFSLLFSLFSLAAAQTVTVLDAAGDTIVEVVTVDPVQGLPTTEIIATIPPTTTAAIPGVGTTPSTTAPAAGEVGPVGQPAPAAAGDPNGPTPFTFTTTDANGNTIQVASVFTPSFPAATGPVVIPTTGTILGYSAWLGLIGTATSIAYGGSAHSAAQTTVVSMYGVLCATIVALASGAAVLAW